MRFYKCAGLHEKVIKHVNTKGQSLKSDMRGWRVIRDKTHDEQEIKKKNKSCVNLHRTEIVSGIK